MSGRLLECTVHMYKNYVYTPCNVGQICVNSEFFVVISMESGAMLSLVREKH